MRDSIQAVIGASDDGTLTLQDLQTVELLIMDADKSCSVTNPEAENLHHEYAHLIVRRSVPVAEDLAFDR